METAPLHSLLNIIGSVLRHSGAIPCILIDLFLISQVVAPESCRHCYSEDLALMPNCYFVNDYKRAHMDVLDEANIPSRAEVTFPFP